MLSKAPESVGTGGGGRWTCVNWERAQELQPCHGALEDGISLVTQEGFRGEAVLCAGWQGKVFGITKWLLYLKERQFSPDNLRILSWFLTQRCPCPGP